MNVVIIHGDEADDDLDSSSSNHSDSSEFLSDEDYEETDGESEHEYPDRNQQYSFALYRFLEEGPFKGPPAPKARSGHRIVYYKGSIYSFGGYNPKVEQGDPEMLTDEFWPDSRPLFRELWQLNLATRSWNKIRMQGDIPEQLASHAAVLHPAYRGVMIVYGGTGSPFGLTTSNNVVACNLESGNFHRIQTLPEDGQPMSLYGQAVVVDDKGRLYTVGGTSGISYFMDVFSLDLTSKPPVWEKLYCYSDTNNSPSPRYRHEICCYQDRLYVLGGGTSFSVYGFEDIPTFHLATATWTWTKTKPDENVTIDRGDGNGFPEPRRCHGAVHLGNKVFVLGGYDGEDIFGDVWRLDLDQLQWRRIPIQLPTPVYFQATTVTEDGKLVIFGGVDSIEENTRTNRVYTAWLTVPSLRAMAWEAVQHYSERLATTTPNSLQELGVPVDCIQAVHPQLAHCG